LNPNWQRRPFIGRPAIAFRSCGRLGDAYENNFEAGTGAPVSTAIIIDPEFRSLIPPMSADSLAQLEANIREHGLRDKMVLWEHQGTYTLIDGHHRLDILKRMDAEGLLHISGRIGIDQDANADEYYQILGEVGYGGLPDREAVKLWILQNQVGRRNLTKEQRVEMVAKIVLFRQEQSAAISKANLKQGHAAPDVTETATSGKRTVAAAAKEFDVPREPLQAAVNAAKGKPPRKKRKGPNGTLWDPTKYNQHPRFSHEYVGACSVCGKTNTPEHPCAAEPEIPSWVAADSLDFETCRNYALNMLRIGYDSMHRESKVNNLHLSVAKRYVEETLTDNEWSEGVLKDRLLKTAVETKQEPDDGLRTKSEAA